MDKTVNFELGQEVFTTISHNKVFTFEGTINIANQVTPELVNATFKCEHCGRTFNITQGGGRCKLLPPEECSNKACENKPNKFKFIQKDSKFSNYQEIWLRPFETPRIKLGKGQKIILKDNLVGVKEGENIRITGKLGFELKGRTTFALPVILAKKIKRLD